MSLASTPNLRCTEATDIGGKAAQAHKYGVLRRHIRNKVRSALYGVFTDTLDERVMACLPLLDSSWCETPQTPPSAGDT